MKILYGKFENDSFLITLHAHADSEAIYQYDYLIEDKNSGYISNIVTKRMDRGSFEIVVELAKKGKHPKLIKRIFHYMIERNFMHRIGKNLLLKRKEEMREQLIAYISRTHGLLASENIDLFYKNDQIESLLDIISGTNFK